MNDKSEKNKLFNNNNDESGNEQNLMLLIRGNAV